MRVIQSLAYQAFQQAQPELLFEVFREWFLHQVNKEREKGLIVGE